jgi:hypothetical protein
VTTGTRRIARTAGRGGAVVLPSLVRDLSAVMIAAKSVDLQGNGHLNCVRSSAGRIASHHAARLGTE